MTLISTALTLILWGRRLARTLAGTSISAKFDWGPQTKPVAFEDPDVRFEGRFLYDSESVAAKTPHFEEFSDLRMSDLRTVDCIRKWHLLCPQ
jgi:hypothetical protein